MGMEEIKREIEEKEGNMWIILSGKKFVAFFPLDQTNATNFFPYLIRMGNEKTKREILKNKWKLKDKEI